MELALALHRDSALRARVEVQELERRRKLSELGDPVKVGQVIAEKIKALREAHDNYTQEDLAEDMRRLGFVTWKRMTVTEVELGKRRPSWEELVGLAILFGVSVAKLIGLADKPVALNERMTVSPMQLQSLVGAVTTVGPGSDGCSVEIPNTSVVILLTHIPQTGIIMRCEEDITHRR